MIYTSVLSDLHVDWTEGTEKMAIIIVKTLKDLQKDWRTDAQEHFKK